MSRCKLLISLLIIIVVGLHALPLLQRLQGKRQTLWPIMAWGMYRNSVPAHATISTALRRIVGITDSGKEVVVEPKHSGLSSFAFDRMYGMPMWQGNASAARELAERLNRKRDEPFIEFRLEGESYTLTDSGIVQEALPIIAYRVSH